MRVGLIGNMLHFISISAILFFSLLYRLLYLSPVLSACIEIQGDFCYVFNGIIIYYFQTIQNISKITLTETSYFVF